MAEGTVWESLERSPFFSVVDFAAARAAGNQDVPLILGSQRHACSFNANQARVAGSDHFHKSAAHESEVGQTLGGLRSAAHFDDSILMSGTQFPKRAVFCLQIRGGSGITTWLFHFIRLHMLSQLPSTVEIARFVRNQPLNDP